MKSAESSTRSTSTKTGEAARIDEARKELATAKAALAPYDRLLNQADKTLAEAKEAVSATQAILAEYRLIGRRPAQQQLDFHVETQSMRRRPGRTRRTLLNDLTLRVASADLARTSRPMPAYAGPCAGDCVRLTRHAV